MIVPPQIDPGIELPRDRRGRDPRGKTAPILLHGTAVSALFWLLRSYELGLEWRVGGMVNGIGAPPRGRKHKR